MGFTDEGRFSEGEAVLPPCAGRIRGLSCKTPAPQGAGVLFWTTAVPDAGWLSGIGVSDRVNLFRRRASGSRADFVPCTKFEDLGGGCKLPEDGC